MKFSIVTPTLNRMNYLRLCIESVIDQDYKDVEHVIVDAGSTDGTVPMLESLSARYGERIRWISEPDRGISDGVNKGFQMANGNVINWIGSDDKLANGALSTVASYLARNPAVLWLYGSFVIVDGQGNVMRNMRAKPFDRKRFLRSGYICGPSVFFRAELARKVGPVREDLKYAMDFELCLRMAAIAEPHKLDAVLAYFSFHPGSITMTRRLAQLDESLRFSLPFASSSTERGILILSNKFYKVRSWTRRLPWRLRGSLGRA